MLQAVAEDFSLVSGTDVTTLIEPSVAATPVTANIVSVENAEQRDAAFDQLVRECDATILIAPEFEGILLRLATRARQLGGRLLSPGPEFIEIASDKHETATCLVTAGVATPRGLVVMPGERTTEYFDYPAVLKPIDGAGSMGVMRIEGPTVVPAESGAYRLEKLIDGQPVSMAILCGGPEPVPLALMSQKFASEADFTYLGGQTLTEPKMVERVMKLALSAIQAMPQAVGYVGIDIVLGEAVDGSDDHVIEINPRYTTSYVGLRAGTQRNLAELVLQLSNGDAATGPQFDGAVQFDTTGNVVLL